MTKIVVDPKTSQTRGTKRPFRCLDSLELQEIFLDTTYVAYHDGTNFKFSGKTSSDLW